MGVCLVMDEIRLILEPTHAHGKFVDHVILATEGGRGPCVTPLLPPPPPPPPSPMPGEEVVASSDTS